MANKKRGPKPSLDSRYKIVAFRANDEEKQAFDHIGTAKARELIMREYKRQTKSL